MSPLLVASGLSRAYVAGHGRCWARVQVLNGLSLSLARSDRVLVTGARGSGKTTLLHCLTGLRRADAGTVRWDARQGTPYRLCVQPSELALLPPRGIALLELPEEPREAGRWIEALHAHGAASGWLVFASRHGALAPIAGRILRLHDGVLHATDTRLRRRVAESTVSPHSPQAPASPPSGR